MSYRDDSRDSTNSQPESSLDIATTCGETRDDFELENESDKLLSQPSRPVIGFFKSKLFGHPSAHYSHLLPGGEEEAGAHSSEQLLERLYAKNRSLWRWRLTSILSSLTLLAIGFGFWTGHLQVATLPPNADVASSSAGLESFPL